MRTPASSLGSLIDTCMLTRTQQTTSPVYQAVMAIFKRSLSQRAVSHQEAILLLSGGVLNFSNADIYRVNLDNIRVFYPHVVPEIRVAYQEAMSPNTGNIVLDVPLELELTGEDQIFFADFQGPSSEESIDNINWPRVIGLNRYVRTSDGASFEILLYNILHIYSSCPAILNEVSLKLFVTKYVYHGGKNFVLCVFIGLPV